MSSLAANPRHLAAAAAAAVLVSRARDAKHLPRLLLEDGSPVRTLEIWASALALYSYEKLVAALLRRLGLSRIPSTLAGMLSLFLILQTTRKARGKETSERLARLLRPGVDFLGKWMGLFLAPPLVSLDASIKALPPYSQGVWGRTVGVLACGWTATHSAAGAMATRLVPQRAAGGKTTSNDRTSPNAAVAVAKFAPKGAEEVSQDEAVRRAWVFLGALSYVGVALSPLLPLALQRPLGMCCEVSTTIGSFCLAKLVPEKAQRALHPLVICAVSSNLAARYVGPVAPYFDAAGTGVGDRLFRWLPAAVTGLGVRMYSTTDKWLDDPEDFKCVLATCGASSCFSILATSLLAVAPQSPLSLPAPLALPLLNRSVMSALGIEGSKVIGPECDPKLAVASILITGCIGASLGSALLESCPGLFEASNPLVRGVAMGCSAHSIGTAGLITAGEGTAAAISGASMCLAGTAHTVVLQLPGVVPWVRGLAGLAAQSA